MSFELGKGIQTWEDLKTAIAVLNWLQSQQSYIEIQTFLQVHIIKSLRDMKDAVEFGEKEQPKDAAHLLASVGPISPPEVPPQEDSQAPPDQSKTPPKE